MSARGLVRLRLLRQQQPSHPGMRRSLCLRWLPVMVASQSTHCLCLQTTSTVPSMTVRRLVAGHHMSLYRVRYCGFALLLPFSHVHICVGGYPSSAASDLASCSSIADAVRMRARYDALHALQNRALRVRSLPQGPVLCHRHLIVAFNRLSSKPAIRSWSWPTKSRVRPHAMALVPFGCCVVRQGKRSVPCKLSCRLWRGFLSCCAR